MSVSERFQEVLEEGDLFFPLSKWPSIAKERILKLHKTRNERYYLMRFLTYNGMRPELASNWILREGQYDHEALSDQAGLIQKAKSVDFFRNGRIFNMRYGRTDTYNEEPQISSAPPPSKPALNPVTVPWEKVLDMFPRPTRSEFTDEFEFQLALLTWKTETRRAIDKWKDQGLIMDF